MTLISMSRPPSGARAGRYETRSRPQMSSIEMKETGSATMNHCPQDMGGSISLRAMRFCGDDIGELCPPMFAASAMAS
jgi:hypothetical protein